MGGYGEKQQQLYHEVIMKCRLADVLIFPLGDAGKWVLALVFFKALLLICLSLSFSLSYLFIYFTAMKYSSVLSTHCPSGIFFFLLVYVI